MAGLYLQSIEYEPIGERSLFERWEEGVEADLAPPLAVRDPHYRARIVATFAPYLGSGRRLVSVGAGNGFVEVELAAAGWDVLASDPAPSARALCGAKGLRTAELDLTDSKELGVFDAIYCDGVMGHLWEPAGGCSSAWRALARLGSAGAICVVVNELSEDDVPKFRVRSAPRAAFYRPPAGRVADDARATRRWDLNDQWRYEYVRSGCVRQREILVMRLLMNKGVETEDRSKLA